MRLFNRTRELETQIEQFFDAVSEGAIIFRQGVESYLGGDEERLAQQLEAILAEEHNADDLRRQIESHLYSHSLIPEQRGDVLGLLESSDDVIDATNACLAQIDVERPEIPAELADSFAELARLGMEAAEALVRAGRAFFRDVGLVKDHLHKVYFYESEADAVCPSLKRRIFSSSIDLAHKLQLRQIAEQIERVSDQAEAVADRIAIYAIKRTV